MSGRVGIFSRQVLLDIAEIKEMTCFLLKILWCLCGENGREDKEREGATVLKQKGLVLYDRL